MEKGEITAFIQYVKASGTDLEKVLELMIAGKLKTEIQEVIPFAEIRRAHQLIDTRHTRGKIVINEIH